MPSPMPNALSPPHRTRHCRPQGSLAVSVDPAVTVVVDMQERLDDVRRARCCYRGPAAPPDRDPGTLPGWLRRLVKEIRDVSGRAGSFRR